MCSGGSVPKAKPIEPMKSPQADMDRAADDVRREQMMRRGLMSQFSDERGLQFAGGGQNNPDAGKQEKLG